GIRGHFKKCLARELHFAAFGKPLRIRECSPCVKHDNRSIGKGNRHALTILRAYRKKFLRLVVLVEEKSCGERERNHYRHSHTPPESTRRYIFLIIDAVIQPRKNVGAYLRLMIAREGV